MATKIPVPVEFLEELRDLLKSLNSLKEAGSLTPQTADAAAKVISWIPHFQPVASQKFKEPA